MGNFNKDYARHKLGLLLRDLNDYDSNEFWREMSRIASGATKMDHAEQYQEQIVDLTNIIAQYESRKPWSYLREYKLLQKENQRISDCLERKTDVANQLKDGLEESFIKQNELAATVERLRDAGNNLRNDIDLSKIVGAGKRNLANEWDAAISATPRQNLNAAKREVYADGFYDGYVAAWDSEHSWQQDHISYGLEQSEIEADKRYPGTE